MTVGSSALNIRLGLLRCCSGFGHNTLLQSQRGYAITAKNPRKRFIRKLKLAKERAEGWRPDEVERAGRHAGRFSTDMIIDDHIPIRDVPDEWVPDKHLFEPKTLDVCKRAMAKTLAVGRMRKAMKRTEDPFVPKDFPRSAQEMYIKMNQMLSQPKPKMRAVEQLVTERLQSEFKDREDILEYTYEAVEEIERPKIVNVHWVKQEKIGVGQVTIKLHLNEAITSKAVRKTGPEVRFMVMERFLSDEKTKWPFLWRIHAFITREMFEAEAERLRCKSVPQEDQSGLQLQGSS